VDWRGRRIWHPDQVWLQNTFNLFRRSFELDAVPDSAVIHITADTRYRLYVNGSFVGHGPLACDPRYQSFDSYDVAELLREGENIIGVEVWFCGYGDGVVVKTHHMGWFLAQLELGDEVITTDKNWRVIHCQAWPTNQPPRNVYRTLYEQFDARKMPQGWDRTRFDDSGWQKPKISKNTGKLIPREIPYFVFEEHSVQELVEAGELTFDDEQAFFKYDYPEAKRCRIHKDKVRTGGDGGNIKADSERTAYLLYDMGRYVAGRPYIDVTASAGTKIHIIFSEMRFPQTVYLEPTGIRNLVSYICKDGRQRFEAWDLQAYRYLQVMVSPCDNPVEIHDVGTVEEKYNTPLKGDFDCSEPVLTRFWHSGRKTVYACMHDFIYDNTYREQSHWTGDVEMAKPTIYVTYGAYELCERGLLNTAYGQEDSGRILSPWPSFAPIERHGWYLTGAPNLGTELPGHGMHWVISVYRHYMWTGNRDLLLKIYPNVIKLVNWFEEHADENGLLTLKKWTDIMNWIDHYGQKDTTASMNALYAGALLAAWNIANALGKDTQADIFRSYYERIKSLWSDTYWDDSVGLINDVKPAGEVHCSEHSNIWAILFDLVDEKQARQIANKLMDWGSVHRGTPWVAYYGYRAMAKMDRKDYVTRTLKEQWANMRSLELADTFSEEWVKRDIWGDSVCQSCGAVATAIITQSILGIEPVEPGFKKFIVRPFPGELEWASGVVPTPYGDIRIEWKRQEDGRIKINVDAPDSCEYKTDPNLL